MIRYALMLALLAGAWMHGNYHGTSVERLAWQGVVQDATDEARATERKRQKVINDVLQRQSVELAGINAGLVDDLDELRDRPPRRSVSDDPGTDCTGATGAALARPDAGFLTRKTADHDKYLTGLTACYAYADALIELLRN